MKPLARFGLVLFLAGFGLWLYTLTLNTFTLTPEIVRKTLKPVHQSTLGNRLQPMLYTTFSNGWQFTYEFDKILNKLNSEYKATQAWDKVIYDEYSFAVSKAAAQGPLKEQPLLWLFLTFGIAIIGALLYVLPDWQQHPGIKNNHIFQKPATGRGWLGWTVGTFLIVFYILLYYFPQYLVNWTLLVDPLSKALNSGEASRWFLYGTLYTVCVVVMGVRMLIKYRHSRYQQVRTVSVMFFQTAFAFLIPELLISLNKPYFDFKNMWPLDYDFFFDYNLNSLIESGSLGIFMLVWGILLFLLGVPIMTYFFGKRWYCSWVCGCGGLAETLGDPYRQLSDKSLASWKIERYSVHGVLALAVIMTAMVLYTYFTGSSKVFFIDSYSVRSAYGFWIGSIFAGVVGTGFYPLMGNRVWCRFGCPLAAYLGLWQRRKSRFRITTNGGQCISCGNCSTYCEMGIDVRAYAQRGQDIVRSSCVGCGICSAVCPRGVLNLENASENSRVMVAPEVLAGNSMKH
ncbi:MAG: 4Fe-4S binding protein [Spirosomataceae bacterium]